jgi:hypothetical protein
VVDELLSEAVVTYVWGNRSAPWPSTRPEALSAVQRPYLPALEAIVEIAFAVEPTASSLAELADSAEAAVHRAYPELSSEALRAIGNLYSFSWK